jgi:hypothetical protein
MSLQFSGGEEYDYQKPAWNGLRENHMAWINVGLSAYCQTHPDFLLGLQFDREDGGNMFV